MSAKEKAEEIYRAMRGTTSDGKTIYKIPLEKDICTRIPGANPVPDSRFDDRDSCVFAMEENGDQVLLDPDFKFKDITEVQKMEKIPREELPEEVKKAL